MKKFTIPVSYRSSMISAIKEQRREADKLKKDFTPTCLQFGHLQIYLARHFGFCYGVENAIEIAFKTVHENPDKRIFLLSEMIHNPQVNADLLACGVQFLQDTKGNTVIPLSTLTKNDIVIIPAFGTTLNMEAQLSAAGIETKPYNTTCPFVEKVWNRSEQIARKNYTVIVHGKPTHEETRATFSHAAANTPTLVLQDMADAELLAEFILQQRPAAEFYDVFAGRFSEGFNVEEHLQRIGVVNQTTMLASDTQGISDFLKQTMLARYQPLASDVELYFADTRDTLCYATNDNQSAATGLLEQPADLAIVVGGYNSSNTSHLVELAEQKLPCYFISSEEKIIDAKQILHFDLHSKAEKLSSPFLPEAGGARILVTSGASCPDAIVEKVIEKVAGFYGYVLSDAEIL